MNEAALPEHGERAVVFLSVVSQQLHLHVLHKVIVLPLDRELVQPPALCQFKHPQGVVLFGWVPVVLKNKISWIQKTGKNIKKMIELVSYFKTQTLILLPVQCQFGPK